MTHQDAAAPASPAMPESISLDGGVTVRGLTEVAELEAACRLYREVFAYSGEDQGINARLLKNLLTYGGTVIGALDAAGDLRGMAFGWTAVETDPEDPHVYHFSQAAVVSADLQGQGVGRALKTVQAAVAHRQGSSRMRWTYNPMISRNAHFNLDVLGAQGRWFTRDALAGPGTDRITVEWRLGEKSADPDQSTPDRRSAPEDDFEAELAAHPLTVAGEIRADAESTALAVPAQQPTDPVIIELLRTRFQEIFTDGFVAVSCRRVDEDLAVYRFARPA
ncbi:hypothetical protein I2485_14750 [Nesterenkonia sp. E16_7]|uniref:hypothetical protein n=1 Tax=unclassified Nesterenkonia TaxID=2629769 RepID=UPI001A91FCDA|nr:MULTISPECIES: hypothetical protein [unclassified Nesterenkonia]MBO0597018.1 hypothetical protein [Nesterenkonia sp. E16_10]MBO0599907.1 hypothetical protein [Nesterenkonia sp. E16_7]